MRAAAAANPERKRTTRGGEKRQQIEIVAASEEDEEQEGKIAIGGMMRECAQGRLLSMFFCSSSPSSFIKLT